MKTLKKKKSKEAKLNVRDKGQRWKIRKDYHVILVFRLQKKKIH